MKALKVTLRGLSIVVVCLATFLVGCDFSSEKQEIVASCDDYLELHERLNLTDKYDLALGVFQEAGQQICKDTELLKVLRRAICCDRIDDCRAGTPRSLRQQYHEMALLLFKRVVEGTTSYDILSDVEYRLSKYYKDELSALHRQVVEKMLATEKNFDEAQDTYEAAIKGGYKDIALQAFQQMYVYAQEKNLIQYWIDVYEAAPSGGDIQKAALTAVKSLPKEKIDQYCWLLERVPGGKGSPEWYGVVTEMIRFGRALNNEGGWVTIWEVVRGVPGCKDVEGEAKQAMLKIIAKTK